MYCIETLRDLADKHELVAGNVIGNQTTEHDIVIWLAKWFYAKFGYKPDRSWEESYDIVVREYIPAREFGIEKTNMWQCLCLLGIIGVEKIHEVEEFDPRDRFWKITEKFLANFFCDHVDEMCELVREIHKVQNPEDFRKTPTEKNKEEEQQCNKSFLEVMASIASGVNPESLCGHMCIWEYVQDLFCTEVANRMDYVECCDVKKTFGNDSDILLFSTYRFDKVFEQAHAKTLKELTSTKADCWNILAAFPKCELNIEPADTQQLLEERTIEVLTKAFEDYVWGIVLQKIYARLGESCFV